MPNSLEKFQILTDGLTSDTNTCKSCVNHEECIRKIKTSALARFNISLAEETELELDTPGVPKAYLSDMPKKCEFDQDYLESEIVRINNQAKNVAVASVAFLAFGE